VLIDAETGGDNPEPDWFVAQRRYQPHDQPGELYNLADDLPERVNRWADQPQRVADMQATLADIRRND